MRLKSERSPRLILRRPGRVERESLPSWRRRKGNRSNQCRAFNVPHPHVAAFGEMLFLMTDKGNYLLSTSSFSLISLLLCNSSPAASLSMSPRKD